MRHDFGEVTLHSAEAIPEWLTPENCPLCHFQQLKKEAFHSQDLGVYHSVHHKMYTCLLQKKKKVILKSSSRFTAELRRRYRDFHVFPAPTHVQPLPLLTSSTRISTLNTTDEAPLPHYSHPKSIVYTRVPS